MRKRSFVIILAGANTLLREGLTRILVASDFQIAASVADIDNIDIEAVKRKHKSLLLIIESGEPDAAIRQVRSLKAQGPGQRVIVLTNQYRMADVTALYQAGASACLVQIESCDVLIKSIELVMLGEALLPLTVLPSETAHQKLCDENSAAADTSSADVPAPVDSRTNGLRDHDGAQHPQLSPCEQRILERLIEGDSNKAIARKVNVAEATVKSHLKSILRKIHVQNRTQAAIWAMNNLAQAGTALKNLLVSTNATCPSDIDVPELPPVPARSKPALRLASSTSASDRGLASPHLAGPDSTSDAAETTNIGSRSAGERTDTTKSWYHGVTPLPKAPSSCLQLKEVRTRTTTPTIKRTSA